MSERIDRLLDPLGRLLVRLGWLHSPSLEGIGACPRCLRGKWAVPNDPL